MLQFLGTGGIGCKTRCNTSILINNSILLDIGSGVVSQMKRLSIDISKINYLLISHYHTDHFSDISIFLSERLYNYKKLEPLVIIGPKNIKQKIVDFINVMDDSSDEWNSDNIEKTYNIKFCGLEEETYLEKDIKIMAVKLKHGYTKENNGYILQFKNINIGYCPDTSLCAGLNEIVSHSDLVLIDCAYLETTDWHLGLNDVTALSIKNNEKNFYAIHRKDYNHNTKISNLFFPEDCELVKF